MKITMRVAFLAITGFGLAGCSLFRGSGDEVIFDTALGPRTEVQIRQLPEGLIGPEARNDYRGSRKGEGLEEPAPGTAPPPA